MGPSAFAVHRLGTIDSTNDWLLAAAREGAADRSVAVADFQRKGRGRLDRRWEAPAGSSLLCSVLLRVGLAPEARQLCSVAVGLAAATACEATADVVVGLKWPNDLVVDDAKLGGILAETDGQVAPDGTTAVVAGVGVNLTWPGPDGAGGTSLLEASGRAIARDALLERYLDELAHFDAELRDADRRASLARAYRARLVTLSRRVRVELAGEAFEGVATDVTDRGHLLVATASGDREVSSGDVVHLRDAVEGASGGHG